MSDRKFKRTGSELRDREITEFGLVDDKGRAIAFVIEIFEVSHVEIPADSTSCWPDNPAFIATPKSPRGGSHYGNSTPATWGSTLGQTLPEATKPSAAPSARPRPTCPSPTTRA